MLSKIAVLDTKLEQQVDYQTSAEQLRQAISDYLNFDMLMPLILNKLLEKVQVGCVKRVEGQTLQENADRKRQQEICIVWRFDIEV